MLFKFFKGYIVLFFFKNEFFKCRVLVSFCFLEICFKKKNKGNRGGEGYGDCEGEEELEGLE